MTDLSPKVLAQRGNEVMAAMSAVTAGIDIRDGNFTDAIVAAVWEHDAILKLKAADPEFKEVVGVGYVWYSPDETAWHDQRQATLQHLNQNSVADICKELEGQGALFDIGRPDYATTSRTQAVGIVADRLRERGATKIIMFLQSAQAVVVTKGQPLPYRVTGTDIFEGATEIKHTYQAPSEDNPNGAVVCSVTYNGETWMQADVEADPREVRTRRALLNTLAVAADNIYRKAIIAQGTIGDEQPNS
jgi:hypothetical protein